MDGLIIKEKWLRLILSGLKSWEIRGSRTKKRGTIYLIQSGSSHIMGQVDIVDCIELTKKIFIDGSLEGYKSVWKMRG